jgi:tetratricopeptide (TPR) repeat protein
MKSLRFLLLVLLPVVALAVEPIERDQIKTLLADQKWTEAQTLLERVIAAEPANAEAHFHLGRCFLFRSDTSHALPELEKAVELDPTNAQYVRHLGDACGQTAQKAGLFAKAGWAKRCKAAYVKAVELDPKDLDARWSLMEYCRQAPGFLGGSVDQAFQQAEAIKQIDPHRGLAAFITLYVGQKRLPEAFALGEEMLREKPDDFGTLYQIGKLADTTGQRLDLGLAALRQCLTITPAGDPRGYAPAHWRIGNILARTGDKAGARAAYAAALKDNPRFAEAAEALQKLHE